MHSPSSPPSTWSRTACSTSTALPSTSTWTMKLSAIGAPQWRPGTTPIRTTTPPMPRMSPRCGQCVYIYLYIFIYTCMYVYVYICVCICIFSYICTYVYVYVCLYICIQIYVCTFADIHKHIHGVCGCAVSGEYYGP